MSKRVEDWVIVDASNAAQAEESAIAVPGVISVFSKSAIRYAPKGSDVELIGVDDGDE